MTGYETRRVERTMAGAGAAETLERGAGGEWQVYVEDWDPAYGASAVFDDDAASERAVLAEGSVAHVAPLLEVPSEAMCFIDGRRRVELSLWAEDRSVGARIPGLVGAYAVGAVTVRPDQAARFEGETIGRIAVWGGGRTGDVIAREGYHWVSESVPSTDPLTLLAALQERMRRAEGVLALEAAAMGWNVVLDGPLNRVRSLHELVTGYVKSHHRQLLPDPDHAAVPYLEVGARTALYALGDERYTCYMRVGDPTPGASPWGGIARLEFPSRAGLDAVAERATNLATVLPRFAGQAHRDKRAPVNLTPVGTLERRLARLLGPVELAVRAARAAVITGGVR